MKPTALVLAVAALASLPTLAADPAGDKRAADRVLVNAVLEDLFEGQAQGFAVGPVHRISVQERHAAKAKRAADAVVVAQLLGEMFVGQGPDSVFNRNGLRLGINEGLEALQASNAQQPRDLLAKYLGARVSEPKVCSAEGQLALAWK